MSGGASGMSGDVDAGEMEVSVDVNENPTDAKEQVKLADEYASGGFAPIDWEKAFYWYQKSAEQGYGVGMYHVAYCYKYGRGDVVPKDRKMERDWGGRMLKPLMDEALCGDLNAMDALADVFGRGLFGLSADEGSAVRWSRECLAGYEAAAALGNVDAMNKLSVLYLGVRLGIPNDIEKSRFWVKSAAELGDARAQYDLGNLYMEVYKNKELAYYWYEKSAAQGYRYAKKKLGISETSEKSETPEKSDNGPCYVATCVYGSYDCPEVLVLRRFRDSVLSRSWFGRRFIRLYYAVSPKIVEMFGDSGWFKNLWRPVLDRVVLFLAKR